jgi:hypothetical protein
MNWKTNELAQMTACSPEEKGQRRELLLVVPGSGPAGAGRASVRRLRQNDGDRERKRRKI